MSFGPNCCIKVGSQELVGRALDSQGTLDGVESRTASSPSPVGWASGRVRRFRDGDGAGIVFMCRWMDSFMDGSWMDGQSSR